MNKVRRYNAILIVVCMISFMTNAEIINESTVRNLVIPHGNYTQVRLSGFGYGDESLDSDISKVEMKATFAVDLTANTNGIKGKQNFDLMVFEKSRDYLCYVEAVHMLYHEKTKQSCDFLQKKGDDYFFNQTEKTFQNSKFLQKIDRTKEYFFVIDNTEWPEALDNDKWRKPKHYNAKDDVSVSVYIKMSFTSNDKYEAWSFLFTLIFITLGVLALLSFIFFLRMTCVYQNYAMERRQLKRELMKIKDTEYSNFLFDQKRALDDKNKTLTNSEQLKQQLTARDLGESQHAAESNEE